MAERDIFEEDDYELSGRVPEPVVTQTLGSYGVPINGGNPAGYMDLNYWQSRHDEGLPGAPSVNDMFNTETGQLNPGWARTGRGYEMVPQAAPQQTYENYPTSYGGGGGAPSGGGYEPPSFSWPRWNAPQYTPGPAFVAPPPFSFADFKAPDPSEVNNDPSYKFRRDEGLQAIEHSAAAKGLTRLPQTQKAMAGWNQDFASQEYGNIWDRSANTWSMNRNNAADNYAKNYGISRDVWDRNESQNLNAFDRNYRSSLDAFNFNEREPAQATFDDMYRRWRGELDGNIALLGAGND